jgi:hypothetical protein
MHAIIINLPLPSLSVIMARTGRIIPSVSAAQKWIFYVSSSLQMSPSLTGIQPEKKNDTDFNN